MKPVYLIMKLVAVSLLFTSSLMATNFVCFDGFMQSTHKAKEILERNPVSHYSYAVLKDAEDVKIDLDAIARVSKKLNKLEFLITKPSWSDFPYPSKEEASFSQMFRYFLVLDAINFQYFGAKSGKTFSHTEEEQEPMVGAGLLAMRLWKAREDILDPIYLSDLTENDFHAIVKADIPLPAISQRVKNLRDVGKFLMMHPELLLDEGITNYLKQFDSGLELAKYIGTQIPAYHDPFLKRAQLFVGMLIGRFHDSSHLPKKITDVTGMTVYADYILPMVLEKMGVLDYSKKLKETIESQELIEAGSILEQEIRAATIIASELLLKRMNRFNRYKNFDILDLDAMLWLQGGEIPLPPFLILPDSVYQNPSETHHHRTISTLY